MVPLRVFLKRQGAHGPTRAFSGCGALMLPSVSDSAQIRTKSKVLVFYSLDGCLEAQLGDSASMTTDMAARRDGVIPAQLNNWFGFKNRSTTHSALSYVHCTAS